MFLPVVISTRAILEAECGMERRRVNLLYRLAQDHLYRLGNMNDLIVEVARATRIRHNILRAAPRT